jgi:hypothetical protein
MNAITKIGSVIGVAAVVATGLGLTAGLIPASAAPTQNGANLQIYADSANSANVRIRVEGVFKMSEHDAHGFINNLNTGAKPGGIVYYYFADDPGQNDVDVTASRWFPGAGAHDGGYLRAESDGIHYYQEISVPKGDLNEDPNYFDDNDEIYVQASFIDGDGLARLQTSNVITGLF